MSERRFRKKPVVIEAIQYSAATCAEISAWMGVPHIVYEGEPCGVGDFLIQTLEGEMKALPGDWIIKGVKGEFYPCKPDIFAATYEPAIPTRAGLSAAHEAELAMIQEAHRTRPDLVAVFGSLPTTSSAGPSIEGKVTQLPAQPAHEAQASVGRSQQGDDDGTQWTSGRRGDSQDSGGAVGQVQAGADRPVPRGQAVSIGRGGDSVRGGNREGQDRDALRGADDVDRVHAGAGHGDRGAADSEGAHGGTEPVHDHDLVPAHEAQKEGDAGERGLGQYVSVEHLAQALELDAATNVWTPSDLPKLQARLRTAAAALRAAAQNVQGKPVAWMQQAFHDTHGWLTTNLTEAKPVLIEGDSVERRLVPLYLGSAPRDEQP